MDKIIINEITHQGMVVDGVLIAGSNTKIEFQNTHGINIIAECYNDIECGNDCIIECRSYCKIKCGNSCIIKTIDDNQIETGDYCVIEGECFNEIKTGKFCKVELQDSNEIEIGKSCEIVIGEGNAVKADKKCTIKANNENTIEAKSGSRIFVGNDCDVTLIGKNILLEINGRDSIVYNEATDGVLITRNEKGKLRTYKINKIKKGMVTIENSKICLDYNNDIE